MADDLRNLWNCWDRERLIQAYNHWASWRELHIQGYCACGWVDQLNCYIALHCLQSIQVNLIPLLFVCLKVDALGYIQQLGCVARIIGFVDHIHAEANCLICSYFYIYLSHFIIYQHIPCIKDLLMYYHGVIKTAWKHEDRLRCDIVVTTYGSTQSHFGQALFLCCKIELRQLACFLEQRFRKSVPRGTRLLGVLYS